MGNIYIILPHIVKSNERQMGIIKKISCHHPKVTKKEGFTKFSSMCLNEPWKNKEVFDKGYTLLKLYKHIFIYISNG